jgi:selenocysteine lyase/cysteine desulfurase
MERKEKRLHFLKNYWMQKLADLPKLKPGTSADPKFACAIGIIAVEGKKPAELDAYLFQNHKIHTTTIEWENIKGVRITPNLYTTTKDLDILVSGIRKFASIA